MQRWNLVGQRVFVGAENYRRLAADPVFWQVLGNTFESLVLGLPVMLAGCVYSHDRDRVATAPAVVTAPPTVVERRVIPETTTTYTQAPIIPDHNDNKGPRVRPQLTAITAEERLTFNSLSRKLLVKWPWARRYSHASSIIRPVRAGPAFLCGRSQLSRCRRLLARPRG